MSKFALSTEDSAFKSTKIQTRFNAQPMQLFSSSKEEQNDSF
jgi:hypothetical protein